MARPRHSLILDFFAGSGTTGHAVINLNREDEGQRKYILVEMGSHFDTVLTPRIKKVVYSTNWRSGNPQNRNGGISHCFKYIRLESYEDTLNNLRFDDIPAKSKLLEKSKPLREDYILHYMLDVETRGSQSLLNINAFAEPDKYLLRVKEAASDATVEKAVDLLETFNYLLGLRVEKIQVPQRFHAKFKRVPDPDVPEDQQKKLVLNGPLKQDNTGEYSFRAVYGWMPKNPFTPNDGLREKVLIVWRNLTDDLEKDNTVLDEWFRKNRINPRDFEFDTIYVNGSNNLPNIKRDDENWRVKLIEEEFFKRMWNVERV
jgi:adenine-specific DNA-methyltransferase